MSLMAAMGSAASLGLVTSGASATSDNASLDYLDLGAGEAGLSGFFDISAANGIVLDGVGSAFVETSFLAATPNDPVFGTLDISDDLGGVVEGDFVGFGFTDTTLELLFDVIGGRFDAEFGDQVLLEFTLDPSSGLTLLGDLMDGDILLGSASISGAVNPIPLPAGLPLLGAGLVGFWAMRRRART